MNLGIVTVTVTVTASSLLTQVQYPYLPTPLTYTNGEMSLPVRPELSSDG